MELEHCGVITPPTSKADASETPDRLHFLLSSQGDRGGRAGLGGGVSDAMTVRAEEVTLSSFRTHLIVGATEFGQAEQFRGGVSLVELKRFKEYRVPALNAFAAVRVRKFTFPIATTLTE